MTVVAISAAYGAGGSRVAPMLAQQLGVPFIDRALPMDTAAQVDFPTDEDDPQAGWLERVLKGFVGAEASVTGPIATASALTSSEGRRENDALLLRQAQSGRGVVLGRAAPWGG